MKTFIEFLYSAFIGIAVALFVGFGIWALYPGPKMPEYPRINHELTGEPSEKDRAEQNKYETDFEQYNNDSKDYSRRVALIALVPAVLFFVAGLRLMKNNNVVSEGLALGGVFTSVYALIRAGHSEHRAVVFAIVSVLLVMVVVLAHTKFRPDKHSQAK